MADEQYISFPHYIMTTMFEPGENKQHLVETVMSNLWRSSSTCAHVFEVEFIDATGTWEGIWVERTEEEWSAWLRAVDTSLREAIDATIRLLEEEFNREADDDGRGN